MIYITEVHLEGGDSNNHITEVRWRNPSDGNTGENTKATMVKWIRDGGVAKVRGGSRSSDSTVGVVDANPPYLRTHADGEWNNNLLALPRF